jgi:three-Cys-motif partner protein
MATDIHSKVFDEGTQIKLYILREYLKEWLPVFISGRQVHWNKIFIYDFFAGEGSDVIGNNGSPLIILDELKSYCEEIKNKKLDIKVVFNEFEKGKSEKLQKQCAELIKSCRIVSGDHCPNITTDMCVFKLLITNHDFKNFFSDIYPIMEAAKDYPRFMFLDQYGVKHITDEVLHMLSGLKRTDFIFFISSSFARRFIDNPEFSKYLKLTRQDFDTSKPYHCHRVIYNYYKSLINSSSDLVLAPFSIKKNQNVYGLIFGTHHTLGMEKFLNICWKINPQTGDANFDIDHEYINPNEPTLFQEFNVPTKLQLFEHDLKTKIMMKELQSNHAIYVYTLESGFLPKHANTVINELKNNGKILKDFKTRSQDIHKIDVSYL